MSETAEKTDPDLWEQVKAEITARGKGGKAGQWSARKAQMAVQAYKKRGGYRGGPDADNHLTQWTQEDWGTKSGAKSRDTGERYLPKAAREALSASEYARTSATKRRDTKQGKQFSAQPADVAAKAAKFRHDAPAEPTRADLYALARKRDLPGRSSMSKAELKRALNI